jgi:hypothetical protein
MDFPERREVEVMMDLKENLVQEVYLGKMFFDNIEDELHFPIDCS